MKSFRTGLLLTGVGLMAAPSYADIWRTVYQGLDYLATPLGSPLSGGPFGGFQNGSRFGRVRFVPNVAGDGYRLEFDRIFGPDGTGRPEVLDLGALEIELDGRVSATAGYTTRLGALTGDMQMTVEDLNYEFRGITGAQDFTFSGELDVLSDMQIDSLGFYDLRLTVNNDGSNLTLDGLAAESDTVADFDIGPINVSGNLYFDVFVALLSSFGVDTGTLSSIFPDSPIDRITAEIQSSIQSQADAISGAGTAKSLVAGNKAFRFLNRDAFLGDAGVLGGSTIPEPTTLILAGTGLLAVLRRR